MSNKHTDKEYSSTEDRSHNTQDNKHMSNHHKKKNMTEEQRQQWRQVLEDRRVPEEIIRVLMSKMERGCDKYGRWDPRTDSRDYMYESRSEVYDAINYQVMRYIRDNDPHAVATMDKLIWLLAELRRLA